MKKVFLWKAGTAMKGPVPLKLTALSCTFTHPWQIFGEKLLGWESCPLTPSHADWSSRWFVYGPFYHWATVLLTLLKSKFGIMSTNVLFIALFRCTIQFRWSQLTVRKTMVRIFLAFSAVFSVLLIPANSYAISILMTGLKKALFQIFKMILFFQSN